MSFTASCPRCKTALEPDARFCGNCGTPTGVVGPQGSAVDALASTDLSAGGGPVQQLDQLLGRTLNNRYRVDRKLGEGGFGAVFEGVHLQMGRPVAIKVLHPSLTRDSKMVERFRREAQAACNLRNPHIATTHDFDESSEGVLYIVMELIRGRSLLHEIQQQGALPPERAVGLLDQVCSALAEAHAQEIVHRDIKPENILIEDQPSRPDFVKVVDFGIAKMMHDPKGDTIAKLTAAGQIFGTLEYMSPEQLAGGEVDHRADIYALGAMLYQMLTGTPPFSGTPSQLIAAHLNREPEPPSERRSEVPAALDAVVLRCMAKQPDQRFATVADLREALRQALAHTAAQPVAAATPVPPTLHPAPAAAIAPTVAPAAAPAPAAVPPTAAAPPAPRPSRPPPAPGLPVGVWIAIVLAVLLVLGVGSYVIYRAMHLAEGRADQPPALSGASAFSGSGTGASSGGSPGSGTGASSSGTANPGSSGSNAGSGSSGNASSGSGVTTASAAPPTATPRASSEAELLRLVPTSHALVLALRPSRLMRLPGLAQLWRQHLRREARELTRMLNTGPAKVELALLGFPKLPDEGGSDQGVAVIRGVDAPGTLERMARSRKPRTEQVQGLTVSHFADVSLVALDRRTLLAGTPAALKQSLRAATGDATPLAFSEGQLAHLRVRLPPLAGRKVRRWFHLQPGARVARVAMTLTEQGAAVELVSVLTTDSARTAQALAVWIRQILHNQGGLRHGGVNVEALLRRTAVRARGKRVVIALAGPPRELVAAALALAREPR